MKTAVKQIFVLTVILSFVMIGVTDTAFALLESKTPEELFNESDVIIIGTITKASGRISERVTDYTISVEKYVKNDLYQQTLELSSSGKKDGSELIEDEPIFDFGDRVLLYLNRQGNSYSISPYSTVLGNDGNYEFQPEPTGVMTPYSPYHPEVIIGGFVAILAVTTGLVYYYKRIKGKKWKKVPTIKIAPNENPEFRSNTAYDEKTTEQDIQTEQELQVSPKKPTEPTGEKTTIINPASQEQETGESGGGCLIATAAFGSELAPQVQMLRETRDNVVMHTQSGAAFMTAFNSAYYSFAPTVANWENENPIFKEIVKATITPLITTLSILNYADIDSEAEMLGYGIGVILLNIGMYFAAPAFVIIRLKQHKK